ncbi:MAG: lipocalin family protein [Thiolinea sp.]
MKQLKLIFILSVLACLLSACATIPQGVTPVSNFDSKRYLGKWYEIARLDHVFERNLEQVTAEYSMREDGDIRVLNRGYNTVKQQWQNIEGRAKFASQPNVGSLRVSFFGPFYGGYNIVELDNDYQHALVVGNNRKYLWILSRQPQLAKSIQERLVAKAKALGFPTEKLIVVKH